MNEIESKIFFEYMQNNYPDEVVDEVDALCKAMNLVPMIGLNIWFGAIGPHIFYIDNDESKFWPNTVYNKGKLYNLYSKEATLMPFQTDNAEVVAAMPPPDVEIDIEILTKKILIEFGKPSNFSRLEVKPTGNGHYRINMICQSFDKNSLFMPKITRPWSWYASYNNKLNVWKFSPELSPVNLN